MRKSSYRQILLCWLVVFNAFALDVHTEISGKCKIEGIPRQVSSRYNIYNSLSKVTNLHEIDKLQIYQDRKHDFIIKIQCLPRLKKIIIHADKEELVEEVRRNLSLKEGQFFNYLMVASAVDRLRKKMAITRPLNPNISFKLKKNIIVINVQRPPKGKLVTINIHSDKKTPLFNYNFLNILYRGKIASKSVLEQIDVWLRKKIKEEGVFYFKVSRNQLKFNREGAVLNYSLKLGPRIGLAINSNHDEVQGKLRNYLLNKYFTENNIPQEDQLKKTITNYLQSLGLYFAKVKIRIVKSKSFTEFPLFTIFVQIKKAKYVKIKNITFVGVSHDLAQKLKDIFFAKGTSLIKGHYFDQKYVLDFKNFLKEFFLRRGSLYNKISNPFFHIDSQANASIRYNIMVGDKFFLRHFTIQGPITVKELAKLHLKNREGQPFNPIELRADLKKILKYLLNKGYYFIRFKSLVPDDIIIYDYDANAVTVKLILENTFICRVSNFFIVGAKKTKRWAINNILNISHQQLLTPVLINTIKGRLLRSGVFSSAEVKTLYDKNKAKEEWYRLFIKVKERKAGRITNAIGYRTDLGIKVESRLYYGNLFGSVKNFSAKLRLNRRLKSGLSLVRENVPNNLWEYNTSISFEDPFLWKSYWKFRTVLATSRERFYRFDADIVRAKMGVQKSFYKYFNFSLNYQLEKVRQYNADTDINEISFNVGSLTPRLIFDYRNSKVRPSKGVRFDLTCEFANPSLLSMDTSDLVINYYKVIAKNVIYIPTSFGTIAILLAGGMEKNLATEVRMIDGRPTYWDNGETRLRGYIPSLKVFRLEGGINIRGFSFDESNYLISGEDISTKVVQDSAYFTLIKIEPRYFYSDNIILSAFIDAGRVFYQQFVPTNLRASFGFSFKYVTPVGTIDLDYGVKFHRYSYEDRGREGFGRLHFSIGLF